MKPRSVLSRPALAAALLDRSPGHAAAVADVLAELSATDLAQIRGGGADAEPDADPTASTASTETAPVTSGWCGKACCWAPPINNN